MEEMSGFQKFINGKQDLFNGIISSVASMGIGLLGAKLRKKWIDNSLSGAEREAFDLNAQEAQKARDWNLQMDNTKYQRQVTDMQNAGINPALAMNGGVTTQATSNVAAHASTSPSPMMSVVDLATTVANLKNLKAQRELTDAQARLANANANAVETENKYKDRFELAKAIGQEKANNLTDAQINEVNKRIDKAQEEINLLIKQAKTEEERKNALAAQALVDQANAKQIEALTPVLVELKKAETNEARSRAALAFAQAAYENKLIDSGYIEALARQAGANANEAESIALRVSGENAKRGLTDEMSNGESFYNGKFAKFVGTTLWQMADLFGSVLGISVGYQGNTHKSESKSTSTSTNTNTNTSTSTNTSWVYSRPN